MSSIALTKHILFLRHTIRLTVVPSIVGCGKAVPLVRAVQSASALVLTLRIRNDGDRCR